MAEDLSVLFPDRELTVTDPETGQPVDLQVREFRFREGLEVQVLARALIEALADAIQGEGQMDGDAIAEALAEHADLWMALIARACARAPEWVASLSDGDGDALSDAMWSANGSFFTKRVVAAVAAQHRRQAEESGSPSPKFSMPSSEQATDEGTGTSRTA